MKNIILSTFFLVTILQAQSFAASSEARAIMTVTPSITLSNENQNVDSNVKTNAYFEKIENKSEAQSVIEVVL